MNKSSTVDVLEQAVERLEISNLCPLKDRGDSLLSCSVDDTEEDVTQDADDLNTFVEPSDELVRKIVEQCEYYFCDANLAVDQFLLKHVRRNKDGWVSLKLIACFRKIKRLTRDYRQVQVALRKASSTLEVSADGVKLRRREPFSFVDDVFSRSVIVFKTSSCVGAAAAVSDDSLCPNWLRNEMEPFGTVVDVRLVKPGEDLPADLRFVRNRHPQLGQQLCAVVMFDKADTAEHACAVLNGHDFCSEGRASRETNWRVAAASSSARSSDALRARIVRPLIKSANGDSGSGGGTPSPCCSPRSNRRLISAGANTSLSAGSSPHRGSPLSDLAGGTQRDSPRAYSRSVCGSTLSKNCKRRVADTTSQTPQSSPWSSPDVRRKVVVDATTLQLQQPASLLRQPFGPDGSTGFKNGALFSN